MSSVDEQKYINTVYQYMDFSLILGLGYQIFIYLSVSVKQEPIGDPFIASHLWLLKMNNCV